MLVGEDGPCGPTCRATSWAAGRQVWGPPFPERRQIFFREVINHILGTTHTTRSESIDSLLMKMSRTGLPAKPRRGPQAGKSGDPRSQNADSSRRAQGALGLGFEAKQKVECGAPRAPKARGLARRVAVDWTWASPLPHAAFESAWLCGPRSLHSYSPIARALFLQFLCFFETLLLPSSLICALPASSL